MLKITAPGWGPDVSSVRSGSMADVPERDLDRTISHLLATCCANAGHLDVHVAAAAKAVRDPALLAHHLHHGLSHVRSVSEHLEKLSETISRRVPAVAQQLKDLDQAIPAGRSAPEHVPRGALDMSIAHDLASSIAASAHVDRHLVEAQTANSAGNAASVKHNIAHAVNHIAEIIHGMDELNEDVPRRIPAAGAETQKLHAAVGGEASTGLDRSAP
jgi:hypothetical protein